MRVEDPELDDLWCTTCQQGRENHQSGHARRADREWITRTHSGPAITFRLKPDRRLVVTRVDPAYERRRR